MNDNNMKEIQPVNVWYNGQMLQANHLSVKSADDNLSTQARFEYALVSVYSGSYQTPSYLTVNQGSLIISGSDYTNWNSNTDINEAAYVWVASKLNLTLA